MKKYIYLLVALLLCIQAFAQGHFPGTVLPATPNTAPWNVYSAAPDQRQNASVTNAQSLALVPTAASGTDIFAYYTVDTTGYTFYLVYTTNGSIPTKTNGTVVSMSFAANSAPNRIWAGKIPQQAAGTVVNYVIYVNTTGGTLAASNNRIATSRLGIQSTWTEGDAYYTMMTPGGVTNAVAWYKADTGLAGTTWADQSGYTYNLTRTSAPAGTSTLNFNPVASFTGVTANQFNNTAAKAAWPVGNTATTYYYVARNTAAIANRAALGIGANGAATGFHSGEVATTGLISTAGATAFSTGAATASLASPPDWDNSKSNQGINLVRTGYDGAGASGRNYVAAQGSAGTTNTNNVNPTYANTSAFRIGASGDNGIFWNGDVAEVIVYPSQHGSTDYLKVETYLALKYGITKSGIYQLSNGTSAYNDAVYNNNIAGIGRDNAAGLHQKQSQSQNSGLQPVIGNVNITDTNANNTNSFTADLSALVWGSDTGSTSFATSFAFGTMNNRMERIWKIQETGTVGTVMVAIPASSVASNVSGLNLLVSSSATFNGASVMLPMALQTLGGTQYYTASVDFTSGQFFTFGAYVTGPGGILPAAWYKASEGVYSDSGVTLATSGQDVQQWNSVTGSFNFSQLTAADKPNYTPGVMVNFNPTVTFDRSNTEFMQYTPGTEVIDRASGTLYGLGNSSQINIPAGIFGFDDTMDYPGFHLLTTNKLLLYALNFIPETTGTISLNQPYVYGGSWQMGAGSTASNMLMDLRLDGVSNSYNTVPNSGILISPLTAELRIGGDNNYGSFDGQLPEAVVFENYLNASERDKVDAYFGIKYGITLSHNYYASNWNGTSGTTLWDIAANAGYNNNIAGIGRDDASALNQKQSQSVNSGVQPVIGNLNITNTNANNTNNFSSDLSALVWGSDTGSTSFGTSFVFGGLNNRMARIWKVQETGTVGVVKVALPASQIPTNIQLLSLMVSPDAVFDGSDTRTAMTLETLGGVQYYTATVDFTSGQFFTFAGLVTAPGGVLGASIWVRADSGTNTATNGAAVSQWNDKSANSNNVSQATAANQPLYKDNAADNINFNPVIDFDGSNDILNDSNGIIGTATYNNAAAFVVNVTKAISNSYVFQEALGTGTQITMHTPWSDNTAYWDGANNSRISAAWGGSVNTPYLWTGWNNNSLTPKTSFRRNGLQITSGNTLASYTGNNSNFSIGSTYNGKIGEMAFYPIALTAVERQRVESYLAVKYGFTLDQATAQNYLNSSSAVIWNATANTGYNNNIAGIGRDDFSTLNQKQSQSVNSGLQPVIGNVNITDTNANNINNFSTDLSALVWGSDIGNASFATSFIFGGLNNRMTRIWKVQETGTVGVVKVALRVADLPANVASPAFVVSADAVFDGTDTRTAMILETLGGVQYYTATVDFTSGQFFTFAALVTAPGGVLGASLWLKSDAGVTPASGNVTLWSDQTLTNTFTITNTLQTGVRTINFNNAVYFNGSGYMTGNTAISFKNGYGVYDFTNGSNSFTNTVLSGTTLNSSNSSYFFKGQNMAAGDNSADGVLTYVRTSSAIGYNPLIANMDIISGLPPASTLAFLNGMSIATEFFSGSGNMSNHNSVPYIGRSSDNSQQDRFDGDLGEVVMYPGSHTALQRLQINSYLAIKYGITLTRDNNGNGTSGQIISGSVLEGDYVASDGITRIWNSDAAYQNNIAGIARDDFSALNQKQSQSVNSGLQPVIGNVNITDTNANNTNNFSTDLSALVWGSDTGSTSFATSFVFGGSTVRMTRIWKVQETGTVGLVKVALRAADLPANVSSPALVVSSDAIFDGTDTRTAMTLETLGGVQYYTATVDFSSGQFFTFATLVTAPGGVVSGLKIWHKADAGVTAASNLVTAWTNQVDGRQVINTGGSERPTYANGTGSLFNFNPYLDFTSTSNSLRDTGAAPFITDGDNTIFTTIKPGSTNGQYFGINQTPSTTGAGSYDHYFLTLTGVWNSSTSLNYSTSLVNGPQSVLTFTHNGSSNIINGYQNLSFILNNVSNTGQLGSGGYVLGSDTFAGGDDASATGQISEHIGYDRILSAIEIQRVQTYLALKTGVTLNQNYLASDGATVWWNATTNSSYNNNIAGIGRDDASALNQKQSQSVNSGLQPVIGNVNITDTNANNTNNFSTDLSALVWGSDTGSASFATSFIFGGLNNRMTRIWKVQETGTVGVVKVALRVADLPANVASPAFVVSSDAVFDGTDARTSMTLETLGGVQYYTATVDFTSGQFFTFAAFVTAPGGVVSGLDVWLRGDIGLTGPTTWLDQSGNGKNLRFDISDCVSAATGSLGLTRTLNFNKVADFVPNTWGMIQSDIRRTTAPNADVAVVYDADAASVYDIWGTDLGGSIDERSLTTTQIANDNTAISYSGGNTGDPTINLSSFNGTVANGSNVVVNGNSVLNFTGSTTYVGCNTIRLGDISPGNSSLDGTMGEFVVYNRNLSALERIRLNSYLAIKYGTTLGRNNNGNGSSGEVVSGSVLEGDYLASDAITRIWNSDATYQNNIAGIARDDFSALNQKQSQSVNSGLQPVIGNVNITDTNANNTNNFSTDLSALVWGSDTGSTSFATSFVFGGSTVRMTRIWKVQETGTVGLVKVALRAADLPANVSSPALVVSSDAIFDGTDTRTAMVLETLGGVQYYTATVDFSSGQFFTFAALATAPGGVLGSTSWFKADADVTLNGSTVSAWKNQSLNANLTQLSQATATRQPTYSNIGWNFNPSITYDGSSDILENTMPSLLNVLNATNNEVFGALSITGGTGAKVYLQLSDNGGSSPRLTLENTVVQFPTNASIISNTGLSQTSNLPSIINFSSGSGNLSYAINGGSAATGSLSGSLTAGSIPRYMIGAWNQGGTYANFTAGNINEIITYDKTLTTTEKQQVQTYLAIKYGQVLAHNYLSSSAGIIWNVTTNAGYNNNIAGIARDDFSALNQKQSQSVNSGSQVVMALGTAATSNQANANTISADRQSFIWGDDSGSLSTFVSTGNITYPSRFTRVWKTQNTGTFAENMTVYYPVSAFGTSLASSVGLLYGSSAASLSNGSASVIPQSGTATINGVSYYVFTVPAAQVANMQFFSFTGNTICYKPAVTVGTTLDTKHGITALGRAGSADLDNWPMVRKGAWTVLEAKTKGFVINRLTAAQIAAIPAANLIEGMMIYDTTNNCMKVYTSTDGGTTFNWQCISTQTCPD